MRFRVVGILNKRNLCWHFWGMGVTIAEGLEAQNDYVIMPELAMDHGSELGYYQAPGAFIQMDDDKVHIDQFKTWANSQGMEAQELSELMKQAWKDTFELVKLDLVMFVIMFVISLTGIGGNNGLVRQSNEKDFGVYFICGADWRQCVWIDTVRNLFLVLLPGAIAIIYQFIKYELDPLQPFLLNGWTVLAVVVMLALVFVISSLGFILRTRREKPVNIIGRWE